MYGEAKLAQGLKGRQQAWAHRPGEGLDKVVKTATARMASSQPFFPRTPTVNVSTVNGFPSCSYIWSGAALHPDRDRHPDRVTTSTGLPGSDAWRPPTGSSSPRPTSVSWRREPTDGSTQRGAGSRLAYGALHYRFIGLIELMFKKLWQLRVNPLSHSNMYYHVLS